MIVKFKHKWILGLNITASKMKKQA
jgi:hypothetical protein